jgi:hypothetical protein
VAGCEVLKHLHTQRQANRSVCQLALLPMAHSFQRTVKMRDICLYLLGDGAAELWVVPHESVHIDREKGTVLAQGRLTNRRVPEGVRHKESLR